MGWELLAETGLLPILMQGLMHTSILLRRELQKILELILLGGLLVKYTI